MKVGFEPSQDVDTIRLRGFLCFKFHESQGHKGCVLKGGCIFPSKAMKEGRNAGRKERKEGRKEERKEGRKKGRSKKEARKEGRKLKRNEWRTPEGWKECQGRKE